MTNAMEKNQNPDEESAVEELNSIDPTSEDFQAEQMRIAVEKNLSRKILFMMNACVRCGICSDACHYYCSTADPDLTPASKLERFSRIFNKYFNNYFNAKVARLPFVKIKEPLDEKKLDELFKLSFEECTLCGKCALTCPMGINTGEIMYLARAMLCSIGRLPSGLMNPVKTALEVGNYIGLTTDDFMGNIEWICEEMEDEIDGDFSIPVDRVDADVLYIPHPLEVRDLPFLLMYALKIMHAAGENYTLSSYDFDTVNYAYYQGNKDNMARIIKRVLKAREKLNSKSIVLAPCGHGYRALRWEGEKVLGKRYSFPVLTIVELIDKYLREGRIGIEKDKFEGPITYHDPCNIARRGGVIEPPRNILNAISSNFVEMQPHGARSYCCGGGGGLASTGDYGQKRVTMGKAKAEQIRKTGAKIVATGCFNCMTQIRDLNQAYDLDIEVKSIVELTAGALKS